MIVCFCKWIDSHRRFFDRSRSMSRMPANSETVRMKLAVQADWDNKQFSNALSLHVRRLFEFVLQFESTTRGKLAKLNEKLALLERQLEFLEAQVSSADVGFVVEKDE